MQIQIKRYFNVVCRDKVDKKSYGISDSHGIKELMMFQSAETKHSVTPWGKWTRKGTTRSGAYGSTYASTYFRPLPHFISLFYLTRRHSNKQTNTHTHINTHIHTHTNTQTHTHTHTHSPHIFNSRFSLSLSLSLLICTFLLISFLSLKNWRK